MSEDPAAVVREACEAMEAMHAALRDMIGEHGIMDPGGKMREWAAALERLRGLRVVEPEADARALLELGALVLGITDDGDIGVWRAEDAATEPARAIGDTMADALRRFERQSAALLLPPEGS